MTSAVAAGARTGDNADLVSDAATKIRAERGRTGDPVEEVRSELRKEQMLQARSDVAREPGGPVRSVTAAEVKLRKKALVFYRKLHRLHKSESANRRMIAMTANSHGPRLMRIAGLGSSGGPLSCSHRAIGRADLVVADLF